MIPQKVIEAAGERMSLGGNPVKIGEHQGSEVFICEFKEEMTIGLPELYLWDGSHVKVISGEEALVIMASFS